MNTQIYLDHGAKCFPLRIFRMGFFPESPKLAFVFSRSFHGKSSLAAYRHEGRNSGASLRKKIQLVGKLEVKSTASPGASGNCTTCFLSTEEARHGLKKLVQGSVVSISGRERFLNA